VLSKSGKIIPVMLVGKLLHNRTYPWMEYAEAALITFGVTLFSLNEKKPKPGACSMRGSAAHRARPCAHHLVPMEQAAK
jgi:hypothetical protein